MKVVGNQLQLRITLSSTTTDASIQAFLKGITFKTKKPGRAIPQRMLQLDLKDVSAQTASVIQTIQVSP